MQIVLSLFYLRMFLNHNKNKINWFTLVEVIFVCSLFALMVVWIILAINRSYTFMNNTRLQVRATNFAREWVEMMFNIRDTNRRKYSWKKDEFWNCRGSQNCTITDYITWGLYILHEDITGSGDRYIFLTNTAGAGGTDLYSDEWFWQIENETARENAKITFTGTYPFLSWWLDESWEWTWHTETWDISELLLSETEFYRLVRVYGVYEKDTDTVSQLASSTNSHNWHPVELRFCVKVFYRTTAPHSTELCSIMTNFEE